MRGANLSEVFASHQGEGARAGARHLFVRFAGCNIRCRYCDTPESLVRVDRCEVDFPDGDRVVLDNPVTPEVLASIVERFLRLDPGIQAVALTGGEPMLQHRFLSAWLGAHRPPLEVLLETNAMLRDGLDELLEHVDVVSADLKLPSNSGERALWDEHLDFLAACRRARVEVYVKMPVDDGTDVEEIRHGARLVAEAAPSATLYLQPITEGGSGRWTTSAHRLLGQLASARAELPSATVRPQLHKLAGIR